MTPAGSFKSLHLAWNRPFRPAGGSAANIATSRIKAFVATDRFRASAMALFAGQVNN